MTPRDYQIEELVKLIYGPQEPARLRVVLDLLLPKNERDTDEADRLKSGARVEVHDVSGDGNGPFCLMVNGYGICRWPSNVEVCSPKGYAEEAARVLRAALNPDREPQ